LKFIACSIRDARRGIEQADMLRKLVIDPLQSNCYILGCEHTREGLVIDPGGEVFRIIKETINLELSIRYILLTHFHFDHTGGAKELRDITKAPVLIHELDAKGLDFQPDGYLSDGQKIHLGYFNVIVIHTPGHSQGGVCLHAPGVVFTGDTLFAGSVGRTDFPGGDHNLLVQGVVRKIFPLGDDIRVYPGHGPNSTIGRERMSNPFFR
jgi:glyoxylase-like metal-dependent hydrolase (beta-lactamase superfamily II)